MPSITIQDVSYHYGARSALSNLSLNIESGEIFSLLGPNGGGKTTLFRLLSSLVPLQSGQISICGHDVQTETLTAQQHLGVVFQAPSLDVQLTVQENLAFHSALYGLSKEEISRRSAEILSGLGLSDRKDDKVKELSGGLKRRVELAKILIHQPQVLLMDEPSSGLDPAARSDFWKYLRRIRQESAITIFLTTHLLEEAELSDRIGILSAGELVAIDTPEKLKASVGGETITIFSDAPEQLSAELNEQLALNCKVVDAQIKLEVPDGAACMSKILSQFDPQINEIRLGKPTLEDVFLSRTGHSFWEESK